MSVIIETSIGDIVVDLFTDERPRCCLNFLKLCKIKYYNFSLFHTVQHNLVAQVGDPTATGRGGKSIFGHLYGEQARFFDMEIIPRILHSRKGLISMVNNGSGMHGSQFFFTLADSLDYLDGKHTVFGEVAEGMEIIDKLNNAFCDENHRPHQDVRIYHTVLLDDPYDDPNDLAVPSASPRPTQEMLDSDRIPCDANVHEDEGKTEQELSEMQAEREAMANTQLLEMVGDLPDADVAPPENVLFVCKLNPVTTSDDLEIIFSRFGTIVSCEVIKDQKSGESLQYSFVEFDNEESCNNAYFKMDNVLIDDRRIHVDFSQSVSKFKWKGKGRGVEIQKDGDAPDYILKNMERQSHGYDLVYAEDDLQAMASTKEKKSKKDRLPDTGREERRDKAKSDRRGWSEDHRGYKDKDGRKNERNRDDESYRRDDRSSHRYERHPREENFRRRDDKSFRSDEKSYRRDELSFHRDEKSYDRNGSSKKRDHNRRDSDSDSERTSKRQDKERDHSRRKQSKTSKRHSPSSDDSDDSSDEVRRRRKSKKEKKKRSDDEQERISHKKKKKSDDEQERISHKKKKTKKHERERN